VRVGVAMTDTIPRGEELPTNYVLSDLAPDQVFVRRRIPTCSPLLANENSKDVETATLIPEQGLVGSVFYHTDVEDHSSSDNKEEDPLLEASHRIYEERAVLLQSMEHYETLSKNSNIAKYVVSPTDDVLKDPRFGEQVIIQGCDASQLCIGDVFQVNDGSSRLTMEVTSP
jgi:MOSC domain-containing protein YiiM